ncbi:sulfatase [Streptomyces sp. B6B3]|uniref:sulfatase family protein n=1 Tax=Streptomyces sp. B6B3 TaxID=3153570 RepID=UPI00325C8105
MTNHARLPRRQLLAASTAAVTTAVTAAALSASCSSSGGSADAPRVPTPTRSAVRAAPPESLPPNILLFTLDDMAASTPGCFGGRSDVTPTLDGLAAEGMTFHQAHVPVAVCAPSRAALMTGLYPHRSGAVGFGPVADDVPLLTDLLYERGYLTGILGKLGHLDPVSRYRWDLARDNTDLGLGRSPERYAQQANGLFDRAASERRPFFLMVNAHDPHRPFHGSREERDTYTPAQLADVSRPSMTFTEREADVPGYLDDLAGVRTELAQYQSSCRRADDTLAAVLTALDAAGLTENTVVAVFSDNGMAFPFAKANCYQQSTRSPLVMRWPGVVPQGRADSRHFVSTLDLFPTLCRAAGVSAPDDLDGADLTPLLTGDADRGGAPGRDRVHTVFHETSSGERFEMRATHDERWSYIWNAWSDGERAWRNMSVDGEAWSAMRSAAATNRSLASRVDFFLRRAPEELYDLSADPDARTNLASAPRAREILHQRRTITHNWMRRTGDPLRNRYLETVIRSAG